MTILEYNGSLKNIFTLFKTLQWEALKKYQLRKSKIQMFIYLQIFIEGL